MLIRDEIETDKQAIRAVTDEAFRGHPHSRGTEGAIIDGLRSADALSLSLVSEWERTVVGHVAFSPVTVGDGPDGGWYGLGPLSVLPSHQGRGIGSSLVRTGIERLQDRGALGCVLVGEPGFYGRFGFEPCPRLSYPGVPEEDFLCLWLDGPLPEGEVKFHPAFAAS